MAFVGVSMVSCLGCEKYCCMGIGEASKTKEGEASKTKEGEKYASCEPRYDTATSGRRAQRTCGRVHVSKVPVCKVGSSLMIHSVKLAGSGSTPVC